VCTLKRGQEASFTIDFTPNFDGDGNDVTMLAYAIIAQKETAWPGMNPNACEFLEKGCPLENGVRASYNLSNLKVDTNAPYVC
jgi:hypothetical protein